MRRSLPPMIIAFAISTLFALSLSAQDKKGGIYNLDFNIDQKLIEFYQVTYTGPTQSDEISEVERFSYRILEGIRKETEKRLSNLLDAKVKCIYDENRMGEAIKTETAQEGPIVALKNMPVSTFEDATIKHEDMDLFIHVYVEITQDDALTVAYGDAQGNITPIINLMVRAFDKSEELVWENSISLNHFGTLKETFVQKENKNYRKAETLTPEDIYHMYSQALEIVSSM